MPAPSFSSRMPWWVLGAAPTQKKPITKRSLFADPTGGTGRTPHARHGRCHAPTQSHVSLGWHWGTGAQQGDCNGLLAPSRCPFGSFHPLRHGKGGLGSSIHPITQWWKGEELTSQTDKLSPVLAAVFGCNQFKTQPRRMKARSESILKTEDDGVIPVISHE